MLKVYFPYYGLIKVKKMFVIHIMIQEKCSAFSYTDMGYLSEK